MDIINVGLNVGLQVIRIQMKTHAIHKPTADVCEDKDKYIFRSQPNYYCYSSFLIRFNETAHIINSIKGIITKVPEFYILYSWTNIPIIAHTIPIHRMYIYAIVHLFFKTNEFEIFVSYSTAAN